MPPPEPPELYSAAAETSQVARFAQLAKLPAPNAVWKAGIGNSVLHPLPVPPLFCSVVPPTPRMSGAEAGQLGVVPPSR